MATRREALERRVAELYDEIAGAWSNGMSLKRLSALRSYLESAQDEIKAIDRDERAARVLEDERK